MAVVDTIKQWIDRGELTPGAALPAERNLSERLHVPRPTIRRAINILEQEGLLKTVGPRTRIIAQQQRAMAHSIAILSRSRPLGANNGRKSPGWTTAMEYAILDRIAERGYHVMLINPDHPAERNLEQLVLGRPSGVIISELSGNPEQSRYWARELRQVKVPVVVYGGMPELQDMDRVTSDHAKGAYDLTRLLIARGCRRILMLFAAPTDAYWVTGRREGYEKALAEAGLPALPLVSCRRIPLSSETPADTFEASTRHATANLLEYMGPLAKGPAIDAIMSATDGDAFAAAAACRLLGAVPGKDIQIVGYDNYWEESEARQYEPSLPLATVDKQNPAIGRELADLLIDRIAGRLPAEPQLRVVSPQIVLTQS